MTEVDYKQNRAIIRQNVRDHLLEDPKAAQERRRDVCNKCIYRPAASHWSGSTCEYLRMTGHIRPCAPSKCVEMGVFVQGKTKRRNDLSMRSERRI